MTATARTAGHTDIALRVFISPRPERYWALRCSRLSPGWADLDLAEPGVREGHGCGVLARAVSRRHDDGEPPQGIVPPDPDTHESGVLILLADVVRLPFYDLIDGEIAASLLADTNRPAKRQALRTRPPAAACAAAWPARQRSETAGKDWRT